MSIDSQSIPRNTATCIGSIGVGAVVSTATNVESTLVYICSARYLKFIVILGNTFQEVCTHYNNFFSYLEGYYANQLSKFHPANII